MAKMALSRRQLLSATSAALLARPAVSAPGVAFGPGEQSTYKVSYWGLSAGTATVTVGWEVQQFDRTVWPIICEARSAGLTSVWPIHDQFVSFWDPAAAMCAGADFFVDENGHRRRERWRYDGTSAHVTRQKPGTPPSESQYEVDAQTFDVAGAALALRNTPLVVGETHHWPVFLGVKRSGMTATVAGRERVNERDCFRVEVTSDFVGKLKVDRALSLHLSADPRQVPVRMAARFLLGELVGELTDYEAGWTP